MNNNDVFDRFRVARGDLLRHPLPETQSSLNLLRRQNLLTEAMYEMYSRFNGELNEGALYTGCRLRRVESVVELVSGMTEIWEDAEEYLNGESPLRRFVPILRTPFQTDMGALFWEKAGLPLAAVEYDYEGGWMKVWSFDFEIFLRVIFELSLDLYRPGTGGLQNVDAVRFGADCIERISVTPGLVFPPMNIRLIIGEEYRLWFVDPSE